LQVAGQCGARKKRTFRMLNAVADDTFL